MIGAKGPRESIAVTTIGLKACELLASEKRRATEFIQMRRVVLPHGKLAEIDDNIPTVVGDIHMALMDLPRRMTEVRLGDSRLVVWSAIALDRGKARFMTDGSR